VVRHITIVMILGFILTSGAFTDLPIEEIWSVDIEKC